MSYDPTALATLLRSTGKTAIQIAALMRANRPAHINKDASSQKVDAWIRGKSLPRDEVRGWLADALDIPRADLYRACAGEGPGWPDILPDHTIVRAGTIGCNTYGRDVMLIMARTDGHTLSDNYLTWEQTEKLAAQLADVIGRREVAGA